MSAEGVQGARKTGVGDALAPQPNIADPAGGVTQDVEARAAIVAIIDLLVAAKLMEGP